MHWHVCCREKITDEGAYEWRANSVTDFIELQREGFWVSESLCIAWRVIRDSLFFFHSALEELPIEYSEQPLASKIAPISRACYPLSQLFVVLPTKTHGRLDPLQVPRASARLHYAGPLWWRH